jgi:hypothetical protein
MHNTVVHNKRKKLHLDDKQNEFLHNTNHNRSRKIEYQFTAQVQKDIHQFPEELAPMTQDITACHRVLIHHHGAKIKIKDYPQDLKFLHQFTVQVQLVHKYILKIQFSEVTQMRRDIMMAELHQVLDYQHKMLFKPHLLMKQLMTVLMKKRISIVA